MRFALVNNVRVEATPKQKQQGGLCPVCSQPVNAKCGTRKIWHWAHNAESNCDRRREPETEWHRAWKNNFPKEWQEFVQHDQSGEKHIADVRTIHGLVIEFQHSHLDSQERLARESFHRSMVWVVDGTRLKRDYQRFLKAKSELRSTIKKGFFLLSYPEEYFPNWVNSLVPVYFDFLGVTATLDSREYLWCLFPNRVEGKAVIAAILHESFVKGASNLPEQLMANKEISEIVQDIQQQRARDNMTPLKGFQRYIKRSEAARRRKINKVL